MSWGMSTDSQGVSGIDVLVTFNKYYWYTPIANLQTGLVTIQQSGYYYVSISIASCDFASKQAVVKVNGMAYITAVFMPTNGIAHNIMQADILKLFPGDIVAVYVTTSAALCNMNIGNGVQLTQFSGLYLSPS